MDCSTYPGLSDLLLGLRPERTPTDNSSCVHGKCPERLSSDYILIRLGKAIALFNMLR